MIAIKSLNKIFVFCSLYMDFKNEPPPQIFKELTDFYRNKQYYLITGSDVNGHNMLCESEDGV